ncbi:MAG: trans-aconitate 2-methyltransferase, partial [Candidatus Berkiella sp.]
GWADRFFFKQFTFKGNELVLDIGSGDGKISARIADALPKGKVIGIDNSQSMLDTAYTYSTKRKNLNFLYQDAQDASFYQKYPDSFDLVVSFTVLHWVKDHQAVLEGIHKVLKPEGKFYFRLCSKGGDPIQDIADKMKDNPKYKEYFILFQDPMRRFDEHEYRQLINHANLSVSSVKEIEEQDKIIGRAKLVKQIKSWLPHYHYLRQYPDNVADQYLDDVINTYLKKYPPAQDGTIVLFDHYLEVVGSKPETLGAKPHKEQTLV